MRDVYRSTVSSKGQLVIPAAVRRRFGFEEGTEVIFSEDNGRLILEPLSFHAIYQLQGVLNRGRPSASQLLDEERRQEREREDRPR